MILIANILIVLGAIFSIIYLFGVIWRVEKKLDTSYKLILGSMFFFFISELLGFFDFGYPAAVKLISLALKFAFVILFLFGILEARKMIRQLDQEIPDSSENLNQ